MKVVGTNIEEALFKRLKNTSEQKFLNFRLKSLLQIFLKEGLNIKAIQFYHNH